MKKYDNGYRWKLPLRGNGKPTMNLKKFYLKFINRTSTVYILYKYIVHVELLSLKPNISPPLLPFKSNIF